MEDVMKGYTLAAGLILAAASAMGQASTPQTSNERPCISGTINYHTGNLPVAKKNFLWTLQSENDGVVESALAHVTQMRIMVPGEDMKAIETVLNRLAINGRTQVIRYKAYLATQVFASPGLFREVAGTSYESGDQFFTALASRLQQTMLGYSSN
jgi:hypothetical protein